jgi:hypothetical protein
MGICFQTCGYCDDYWANCKCTDESRRKADIYARKVIARQAEEDRIRRLDPNYKGVRTTTKTVEYIFKKLYGE